MELSEAQKSMRWNDMLYKREKDIIRDKLKRFEGTIQASDIYVYKYTPLTWLGILGVRDIYSEEDYVLVCHCAFGRINWTQHPLIGFLPNGALIVDLEDYS